MNRMMKGLNFNALNLACLGELDGHGRVRVGEGRLDAAIEPMLRQRARRCILLVFATSH